MLKRSSWMSGKAGIMIHYLPPCAEGPNGEKYTSVDDSVDSFDIPAFIERFKKLNAEWLIFTIGQNTGLYNAPNKTLEAQVGPEHMQDYLNEFVFRFNRRRSASRGKLFYRLAQYSVISQPITYQSIIQSVTG